MTTTFVDTAGPGDTKRPRIAPMNGLFAAQDIKAGTIVAHYQLMVVPDPAQAAVCWKKVKAGTYKTLIKAIIDRHPELGPILKTPKKQEAQWKKTLKTLKTLNSHLNKYEDYVLSHNGLKFYPDLSYGIERDGLLCSEAIDTSEGRPYPGLSGMFSNEPGIGQTENVVPTYYESMGASMNGKIDPISFEGARTPRFLLKAKENIPKGAEIVWCYGPSYGDRGYETSCGEIEEPDPHEPGPISDTMLDAIVICCLFDVSGAVQAIADIVENKRHSERILGPGEMAELYKRSQDLTMVRRAERPDPFAQIQRLVDEYIKNPPDPRAGRYMESVQGLLFQIDSKLQSE